MDMIKEAFIDGKPLEGLYNNDEHVFSIPKDYLCGESKHTLRIETMPSGEKHPVAFLRGSFAVKSLSPYKDRDENQMNTKGPFLIKPLERLHCEDLVESGLPFCAKPVKVYKTIELDSTIDNCRIKLSDLKADAARVFVDGHELSWCWGPDWTVKEACTLSAGKHEVVLWLIPNTYNVFGPHHHINGDRHLTSPDQYKGIKNFADWPDAPENTKCNEWNFVRFYIKGDMFLIQE